MKIIFLGHTVHITNKSVQPEWPTPLVSAASSMHCEQQTNK